MMGLVRAALLMLAAAALLGRTRRRRRRERARPATTNGGPSEAPTTPLIEIVERREARPAAKKQTRRTRRLATILIVGGALLVAYAAATAFWRDPVTDLYARWQQYRLSSEFAASIAAFEEDEAALAARRAGAAEAAGEASQEELREELIASANRFDKRLKVGQPLGRIIVPRLDLNKVFVYGTRWAEDLSRGPGHYTETGIPALGKTSAIAGHRTTFGAPFRHIDKLRRGDEITLELPYGTFHYTVIRHKIVDSDDWSIIDPLGFDALVLSACHPLYSAAQRWVVFARLARVDMMDGSRLTLWQPRAAATA